MHAFEQAVPGTLDFWLPRSFRCFLGRRLFLSIMRRRLLASIIEMFKLVRLRLRNLEFIETYAWLEVFFLSLTTCQLGRPLFPIIKKEWLTSGAQCGSSCLLSNNGSKLK